MISISNLPTQQFGFLVNRVPPILDKSSTPYSPFLSVDFFLDCSCNGGSCLRWTSKRGG